MCVSWKSAAILLLLNFWLVFYGQGTHTSVTSLPYTQRKSLSSPLNGNWHLTGVNSHLIAERQLPFLSFAIEADWGIVLRWPGSRGKGVASPSRMTTRL